MASEPQETWDADAMVRSRIRRQDAIYELNGALSDAVRAFQAAAQMTTRTGVAPHMDPDVTVANRRVERLLQVMDAASSEHRVAWRGRELVSLPPETQMEIDRLTRLARLQDRSAKSNGRHGPSRKTITRRRHRRA